MRAQVSHQFHANGLSPEKPALRAWPAFLDKRGLLVCTSNGAAASSSSHCNRVLPYVAHCPSVLKSLSAFILFLLTLAALTRECASGSLMNLHLGRVPISRAFAPVVLWWVLEFSFLASSQV